MNDTDLYQLNSIIESNNREYYRAHAAFIDQNFSDCELDIQIKLRGNSSSSLDKKPYIG